MPFVKRYICLYISHLYAVLVNCVGSIIYINLITLSQTLRSKWTPVDCTSWYLEWEDQITSLLLEVLRV